MSCYWGNRLRARASRAAAAKERRLIREAEATAPIGALPEPEAPKPKAKVVWDEARVESHRRGTAKRQATQARLSREADPSGLLGEWRPIPGWEEYYEVSDRGRIRNRQTGYLLKECKTPHGYINCSLYRGGWKGKGAQFAMRAHRAVALAFIPNPENKPHVNHIDCDRANNLLSNLEWVTAVENNNHHKVLAISAYDRAANIVQAFAVENYANPRVVTVLHECEARIRALGDPVNKSIGGSTKEKRNDKRRKAVSY